MSRDLSFILNPVRAEMEEFRRLYKESLSSSNVLLQQVIMHVTQKHGKMMRPLLLFLITKMFDKVTPAAYHAAVSLELLHTATLIHDDVVDESDKRRGQPSVNAAFNNKVAVLSGDFFLATALQQVSLTRHFEIVDIVAKLGQRLADGELLQLYNIANNTLSYDVYFDIIRNKTAILFSSCCKAGALAAGADILGQELLTEEVGRELNKILAHLPARHDIDERFARHLFPGMFEVTADEGEVELLAHLDAVANDAAHASAILHEGEFQFDVFVQGIVVGLLEVVVHVKTVLFGEWCYFSDNGLHT